MPLHPGPVRSGSRVQGAVGRLQLERVDGFFAKRRKLAYCLNERLAEVEGITTPHEIPDELHVYHLYNTLVDDKAIGMTRDEFTQALLDKEEVHTMTQYSPALNCRELFEQWGYRPGQYPASEDAASRVVTLPIHPRLNESDMDELVEKIQRVLGR